MPAPAVANASYASGGDIALVANTPPSLALAIAERVHAKPDGVVRSYRADGHSQARSRAALWQQAGDIAAALAAAGAAPASHVVILAADILDFLPACWACLRGGFVPLALMHAAQEAVHRNDPTFAQALALLDRPTVLVDDVFAAIADRLPGVPASMVVRMSTVTPAPGWTDAVAPPATAWVIATSGSAGRPKLVTLSTKAMLFRNFASVPATGPKLPHALGAFPLDGLTGQHAAFLHSDSWTQVSPQLLTARPAAILDAIEAYDIATLSLTSSMIRAILSAEAGSPRQRRLGSLRLVGLGAEPILAGIVQPFAALLARHGADPGVLVAGYGATETGSLVAGSRALLTSDVSAPVCVGPPWHGVAMRIVDEAGAMLPEGDVGELEILCPAKMFSAYLGDPGQTDAAFTRDGWWRSGDLGQLVAGELTLRGRAKDVLVQSGRKLPFADIDAEIQQVLGVGGVGYGYRVPATEQHGERLGVAFDAGGGVAEAPVAAAVAAAITAAIVRRFGIQPHRLVAIPADRLPRTSAGKLRRGPLAVLAMQGDAVRAATHPDTPLAAEPGALAQRLQTIWADVLGVDRGARPDDDFFALGGDSLRAVTLDLQLAEAFGVRVPSEAFFAAPNFANLLRLVEQGCRAAADPRVAAQSTAWPLPAALHQGLMSALTHWPGERLPGDAVITGTQTGGDRPPIFWVFNHPVEAAQLAQAMGPSQPLYAMRSGFQLIGYHEDEIQALALRYVAEIMQLRPDGPVFIGGNCQGGIVAVAVANHLLRRKRHVPLLMLLDWAFDLQPYPGRVLLMAGVDSVHLNARRRFARPDLAWSRGFADHAFAELPGGYAEAFHAEHIGALVRAMGGPMRAAMLTPPNLMPESGYQATIALTKAVRGFRPGERRVLPVTVSNDSGVAWAATPASGLVLSSRWKDPAGRFNHDLQPRTPLPALKPGQAAALSLKVVAPRCDGAFTLVLDLLEEGNRWFGRDLDATCRVRVDVAGGRGLWRRLTRRGALAAYPDEVA